MTDQRSRQPFLARNPYRVINAIFGAVLIMISVYGLPAGAELARILVSIAFVVAGRNMLWPACKAKQSWLSKIGPLP